MLDINKAVTDPASYEKDPNGHMAELAPWSPLQANELAALEGLVLTDEHFEIILYLRERYRQRGNTASPQEVLRDLEEHFSEGRGRKRLYELFPGGPVAQASRLAGLPLPPNTYDLSFGSTM